MTLIEDSSSRESPAAEGSISPDRGAPGGRRGLVRVPRALPGQAQPRR